jgi:hypothetical protein
MLKQLGSLLLLLLFYQAAYCQANHVKETVDRDLAMIKYVPYGQYLSKDWKEEEKENERFRKKNKYYHELLKLDTLAIPYLIDRISDTTEMSIRIPCSAHFLKLGDVAFAVLNDIITIPWHAVTNGQWDAYTCDTLPDDGWDYLYNHRRQFQRQLRSFFQSPKGKMWIRIQKKKLSKTERDALLKKIDE